ncbi:two-component sensor histidine kinase [Mycolicibacterium chitae]|uniref:histidine kinase n=1 Tax=Mycolicibacterium chitae TaxID=1792 RepID=A0A3S4RKC6_MYCCI|nr:HAMP domain-containing sensor histidine kinase [Mycolicibacterium chitae]MCV7107839.1 HAMP domain-containing histidine kinase [Mycolicibacterium chitae]BBZ01305.1 two-component sensor histidine kinase [Mycolicibacterium chitae]VEG50144.1 sensor-type histidine kinase prrB [Mycolicibacterium chitae]
MRAVFARWWPRLRASLRVRVAIAAAIAAAAVVAALMVLTSIALAGNDAEQLDRRLDAIVDASTEVGAPGNAVLSTGRSLSTGQVIFQRGLQLPKLPPGTETVTVNGVDYRVRTLPIEPQGVMMSVGIRADSILLSRARVPMYIGIGVLALLIALSLGWLLGGAATRPLRKLTEQTRRLGQGGSDRIDPVRGVKEAEDLSEAMIDTLRRLAAAQEATSRSLQAAQDFAANAAHELRTPLTAMRADLDTLRIHDLPAEERAEVVADLSRAQRRIEATITALGQLASGELAQDEDRELVDLEELLYRVLRENARPGGPEIEVRCEFATPAEGVILAWPGGLRLAVDNLVRNSVLHGRATRVVLTARREGNRMEIIVDDNGRGLPEEEHDAVLGRFVRGSTAASGGSGLGLALVAQQAELHGGRVELADGPLGGLRVILTLVSERQ